MIAVGNGGNDLWSEIIAEEEEQHSNYDTDKSKEQQQQPEIAVIYRRKNAVNKQKNDLLIVSRGKACVANENRVSWAQAPVKESVGTELFPPGNLITLRSYLSYTAFECFKGWNTLDGVTS